MFINHNITIDLANPGPTPRIQVKQGEVLSRNIRITLLENGESWKIPVAAQAVIRYRAHDPEGLTGSRGIFDTLENGDPAYMFSGSVFELMPSAAMMASPGLVTVDVVLLHKGFQLATFDFEIYVNRAPALGTEPQLQSYYRVSSLDTINQEFNKLRAAIEALGGSVE